MTEELSRHESHQEGPQSLIGDLLGDSVAIVLATRSSERPQVPTYQNIESRLLAIGKISHYYCDDL